MCICGRARVVFVSVRACAFVCAPRGSLINHEDGVRGQRTWIAGLFIYSSSALSPPPRPRAFRDRSPRGCLFTYLFIARKRAQSTRARMYMCVCNVGFGGYMGDFACVSVLVCGWTRWVSRCLVYIYIYVSAIVVRLRIKFARGTIVRCSRKYAVALIDVVNHSVLPKGRISLRQDWLEFEVGWFLKFD